MTAAEVLQYFESPFGMGHVEVVRVEADEAETYTIRKGKGIVGAHFSANRDEANTDTATVSFTAGATLITFHLNNTTSDVTGTLTVYTES